MSSQSIVSGYILLSQNVPNHKWDDRIQQTSTAIDNFYFDEKYPFTNVFWPHSPAQYDGHVIGIVGAYKDLHLDWEEWLWKFSQMLSRLEAIEADVRLDSLWGRFSYRLQAHAWRLGPPWPDSFIGEQWGIVELPEWDFSFRPDLVEKKSSDIRWDKFVPRWVEPKVTKESPPREPSEADLS
jgi:hypothetical protein